MDIPELVERELGDETLRRGVMLGDDDIVCITDTRTLLYRAEGLLSDESVETFPHEVERLRISEGRRKTKFVLEYVEETKSLTVPGDVARDVLGLLLEGLLTAERLLDDDESVAGAFRFSELTLVVADHRVLKHVGSAVWEDDYEVFRYEDLTGLDFEEASVATEVVLEIDGRPQRIKTPNDQARVVEQTLKKTVFDYFDVSTMGALESKLGTEDNDDPEPDDDIGMESGIDPLVDDDSGSDGPFARDAGLAEDPAGTASPDDEGVTMPTGEERVASESETDQWGTAGESEDRRHVETDATRSEPGETATPAESAVTQADLDAVTEQISELTEAVNRQNELLRNQNQTLQDHHEQLQNQGQAIRQLIEELRQGR